MEAAESTDRVEPSSSDLSSVGENNPWYPCVDRQAGQTTSSSSFPGCSRSPKSSSMKLLSPGLDAQICLGYWLVFCLFLLYENRVLLCSPPASESQVLA